MGYTLVSRHSDLGFKTRRPPDAKNIRAHGRSSRIVRALKKQLQPGSVALEDHLFHFLQHGRKILNPVSKPRGFQEEFLATWRPDLPRYA
jgi:hypothetical protein